MVIRDGVRRQVNTAEVVPGDILVLTQGQKVPADARVIEAHSLRADESALTGESVGVDKSPEPVAPDAPLAERSSMAFASTFITYGTGLAVAVRTGMATEVGQIAATLQQMAERPTPFQVEVQKMARQMTVIVGSLAVVVALILLFVLREPPVDVALNTLSLAVATIPESLPIVLTFALALGARQMAARHAVVRRLSVVESFGSVDTICTDKTGTLTQNTMSVQRLFVDGQIVAVPHGQVHDESLTEMLRAGALCNEATVEDGQELKIIGDPVDTALLRAAQLAGLDIERERAAYPKVNEIPFSSERKMMTTVHQHAGQRVIYTKGAPGSVLAHCTSCWLQGRYVPLEDAHCQTVYQAVEKLQSEGMYVLALARKEAPSTDGADGIERDLAFVGLQALIDPPRPEAAEAIARAQGAGIRVVMITGDNARTAQAIAGQLGLGRRAAEAHELEDLARPSLLERMKDVDIVARATPQIKQQVLQALQDGGHFVAMTGDGVNDATAHQAIRRRRGDGPARHRYRQGIGRHGVAGRQLRDDRRRHRGRPSHLRQHPQVHQLPAQHQPGRGHCRAGALSFRLFPALGQDAAVGKRRDRPGAGQRAGRRSGRAARDETPPAPPRRADPEQGHLRHDCRQHLPHAGRVCSDLLGGASIWRRALRPDDAVHQHRAARFHPRHGGAPIGRPLHMVEPHFVVELRHRGGIAVAGAVYPAGRRVRYHAAGLAGVGGDDPGGGRLVAVGCLYDTLDLEVGASLGTMKKRKERK